MELFSRSSESFASMQFAGNVSATVTLKKRKMWHPPPIKDKMINSKPPSAAVIKQLF